MTDPDYHYRGLIASTWDLLRDDEASALDRGFYEDIILVSGQPILIAACGTGRLVLDFLTQGMDVDGLDVSPEMLASCRVKSEFMSLRPSLFQQPMQEMDLPREYRTIVVPTCSFQLISAPDDAMTAMHNLFEALEPGGTLVMSFEVLGRDGEEDWTLIAERARPEDGAIVQRWQRAWYDYDQQLQYSENRYIVTLDEAVIADETYTQQARWYTQEQALLLYQHAGFTNIRVLSGFSHEPAYPQDGLFCVTAQRRE